MGKTFDMNAKFLKVREKTLKFASTFSLELLYFESQLKLDLLFEDKKRLKSIRFLFEKISPCVSGKGVNERDIILISI